jgi:hypothetical protein
MPLIEPYEGEEEEHFLVAVIILFGLIITELFRRG